MYHIPRHTSTGVLLADIEIGIAFYPFYGNDNPVGKADDHLTLIPDFTCFHTDMIGTVSFGHAGTAVLNQENVGSSVQQICSFLLKRYSVRLYPVNRNDRITSLFSPYTETIEDAALVHGLNADELVAEINAFIEKNKA